MTRPVISGVGLLSGFGVLLVSLGILAGMMRDGWVLTYASRDNRDNTWAIQALDTATSYHYLIVDSIRTDRPPQLSPDRRYVLENWNGGVFLLDAATGERRAIGGGCCGSWSPDSQQFVYKGDGVLYLMSPDGQRQNITGRVQINQTKIANWSPDGHRLLFEVLNAETLLPDVYILDLNDGTMTKIASLGSFRLQRDVTAWSPDGEQVAFIGAAHHEDERLNLYIAHEGSVVEMVTDVSEIDPVWSPDGRSIAYYTLPEGGMYSLWQVNVVTGERTPLVDVHRLNAEPVIWSPDGRQVAFTDARQSEIYIATPDGDARQMTDQFSFKRLLD